MPLQPEPPAAPAPPGSAIGVYVHIPFCSRRCDYCDFFVIPGSITPAGEESFTRLVGRELLRSVMREGGPEKLETLYFGGGTPSFISPRRIQQLIVLAGFFLKADEGIEITLEANPESVTPDAAAAWRGAGVNRLSLGAQSFDDAVLAPRGRLHTARTTRDAFRIARDAGFDNIGIDLIAGLPGETLQGFTRGLDALADLGPEHVSVYLLETAESGKDSALARAVLEGRARAAGEEDLAVMYEAAVDRLTRAGYEQYEISNFARPGRVSRHNLRYWRSLPYLGVGPSAHSFVNGRRLANARDITAWRRAVEAGAGPEDYTLSEPEKRAREALVLELRLTAGVDTAEFAGRWGLDPAADLAQTLDELEEAGLLRRADGRVALTPRGVLLSNEVFGRIL